MKTFQIFNFGCRVNAAESNLFAQSLINKKYLPTSNNPDVIFINTCSITKKANTESLGQIRRLQKKYPKAKIIISGCASLKNLKVTKNIQIISNPQKEKSLKKLNSSYSHQIKDKFSHTNRYLLKVQSGCTAFCTYCIVPYTRPYLWSLPIDTAINTVKRAVKDGYKEVIVTGVNLNQYTPGFSNLVEALLTKTDISLISFGSIPINCLDQKFIILISNFSSRISGFLHIPIQTGSDKILKLMNRNYTKKIILEKFSLLKNISPPLPARLWRVKGGVGGGLSFGTDIIVGFPGETETDFLKTYNLCKKIGFTKIHVFKYSPRLGTIAREHYLKSEKIHKEILRQRSEQFQKLCSPVSRFV
jgi:threonylcarbamoyladenosine tRNA methylthiotransferase MtaB